MSHRLHPRISTHAGRLRWRDLRLPALCLAAGLLFLLISASRIMARYGLLDIEPVPVERLIRNLEESVAKQPQDAKTLFNLARTHAMIFATKLAPGDLVDQSRGMPPFPPPTTIQTTDGKRLKEAKEHLKIAIDLYRKGIELDPKDVRAKLGYAWCLDQSGDKEKAITAYRQVLAEAWATAQRSARPKEATDGSSNLILNYDSLTVEVAGYLIPLLDRVKDRDEIATLQDRMQIRRALDRAISPIAIPLRDDARPETFLDHSARVVFDADGSGIPKPWSWLTPEAAWLVYAPNKSHPVTSALQLFGNVTFWLFWDNGYQALAALDDNADGALSGTELQGLGLWRDANGNGVAEDGEVKSLADWNIVAVNCAHEKTPAQRDYLAFSAKGVTFKDGHTRPTWDVLLYTHAALKAHTE